MRWQLFLQNLKGSLNISTFPCIAAARYKEMWIKAVELVDGNMDWLADDGWVIVQIAPKEYKTLSLENLEEFDQRKYGSTLLVFYERK